MPRRSSKSRKYPNGNFFLLILIILGVFVIVINLVTEIRRKVGTFVSKKPFFCYFSSDNTQKITKEAKKYLLFIPKKEYFIELVLMGQLSPEKYIKLMQWLGWVGQRDLQ